MSKKSLHGGGSAVNGGGAWEAKMAALRDAFVSRSTVFDACESPLERMFLMAMYAAGDAHPRQEDYHGIPKAVVDVASELQEKDGYSAYVCRYFGCCAMLVGQAVGKYRPDFLIIGESAGTIFRVVVECDGHDFHERTKEQAAHDRKRDRWFQMNGYSVLRFTGSEVFADPEGCVGQVCWHVEQTMRAAWERARAV